MLKRILALLLVCLMPIMLFACNSETESTTDASLVGKWAETDSMYSEYTSDGKYAYYLSGEVFIEGTYSVSGDTITFNYTTDGSTDTATYSINGDTLTLNYATYSVTATRME